MALLVVYLLAGLGCAAYASLRGKRRNVIELLAILLLWPLYAPFVLASDSTDTQRPEIVAYDEMSRLEARCAHVEQRLREIDDLLATAAWDRAGLKSRLHALAESEMGHAALRTRLEQVDRLQFLRNMHADELEAGRALLDQLRAQIQLSRFLDLGDRGAGARLEEIRERIACSEEALAAETELLSLCRES